MYSGNNRIIFLLLTCLTFQTHAIAEQAPLKISKEIRIGTTHPLSGKLAYIGQEELRGLELGVEEINRDGGINGRLLRIITEDNAGETSRAVASVHKLIDIDNVDVVFSSFTHIIKAIQPIITSKKKILFYASAVREMADSSPYVFRDFGDAGQLGEVHAELAHNAKIKKLAYMGESNDSCYIFLAAFLARAKEMGIEIATQENFTAGEIDFRPYLLRLKRTHPEAMLLCDFRDAAVIMRQLEQLGMLNIPAFHFESSRMPDVRTPENMRLYEKNRSVVTDYWFAEDNPPQARQQFNAYYINRYGQAPTLPDSAFSHDDIIALSKALKKCSTDTSVNTDCVSKELTNIKLSDGAAGPLSFDDKGVNTRKAIPLKVVNGRFERY